VPPHPPLITLTVTLAEFDSGSPLYAIIRWIWFASITGLVGATMFRYVVLGRLPHHPEVHPHSIIRAAGIGARAALLCLLVTLLRAAAQSYAVFGDVSREATVLLDTGWGRGWIVQATSSLIALVAFRRAARGRPGWTLAALASIAAAAAPALSGHAAAADAQPWSLLFDFLHVVAAGTWIGSLFVLITAGFPAVAAAHETRRDLLLADLVNAFSPVALVSATVIIATGTWAAWINIGSIATLLTSTYGRVLILKLSAFAVTVAFGAWNYRRIRPHLGTTDASVRLRRSGRLELVFASLVLLVTAFLVAIPQH
jgi:copper transport protein